MLEYQKYQLGIYLATHLPLAASYALANILSELHYLSSKKDRDTIRGNLKAILPDASPRQIERYTHEVFRNFGRYIVEFFRFAKIDQEFIDRHVKIEGREHVEEALKRGKGVIALSAHLGNWELGGVIVARSGYSFIAVALTHCDKRINNFFNFQREFHGVKVLQVKTGIRDCFKALKQNQIIALVGDRDFTNSGIISNFLGRQSDLPRGPAVFHLRTGAPIVPVFMIREGPTYNFRLVIEKPIEFTPCGDEEKDIKDLTDICSKAIETYVRRYPEQWLMFRQFWYDPDTPKEEIKII
ncbi:MAG: lysophospholipid acyltransferase family protein [Candidatus Omnitrophota bacterium]